MKLAESGNSCVQTADHIYYFFKVVKLTAMPATSSEWFPTFRNTSTYFYRYVVIFYYLPSNLFQPQNHFFHKRCLQLMSSPYS